MRWFKKQVTIVLFALCLSISAYSQVIPNLVPVGMPDTVFQGSDIEKVDLMSGVVNVNIPLLNLPGRGLNTNIMMRYTSQQWSSSFMVAPYGQPPLRLYYSPGGFGGNGGTGWNVGVPRMGRYYDDAICDVVSPDTGTCVSPWITVGTWFQSDGTRSNLIGVSDQGGPGQVNTWSYDGSYILFTQSDRKIHYKDGVTAYSYLSTQGDYQIENQVLEDTNGNRIVLSNSSLSGADATLADTLGRTITLQNLGSVSWGDQTWSRVGGIKYKDSDGTDRTITITYQDVVLKYPWYDPSASGVYPPDDMNVVHGSIPTSVTLANGNTYTFEYRDNGDGTTTGELTKITLPTGGYVRYTYGFASWVGSNQYTFGESRVVLSRIISATGSAADEKTWSYDYASDGTSTVTDPLGNKHSEQFNAVIAGNGGASSPGTAFTLYTPPSRLMSKDIDPSGATILQKDEVPAYDNSTYSITSYQDYQNKFPNFNANPRASSETTTLADTNQKASIYYGYGDFGNVTSETYTDWGAGQAGSTLKTVQRSYLGGQTSYAADSTHILDRVTDLAVYGPNCQSSQQMCQRTTYGYDEYGNADSSLSGTSGISGHDASYSTSQTLRGNVTSEKSYYSDSSAYLSYKAYNDLGMVVATKDPNGYKTTYDYADNYRSGNPSTATRAFVTTVSRPSTGSGFQHVTRYQWYFDSGLLAAVCGENFSSALSCNAGQTGTLSDYQWYQYDLMGRPSGATSGNGGSRSVTYNDSSLPRSATETTLQGGTTFVTSTAFYDGLGRKKQTQMTSDPQGVTSIDFGVDAAGRQNSVSNPYRSTSASTDGTTTITYDALGRRRYQNNPDSSYKEWTYSGNVTGSYDEARHHYKRVSDALGRLVQVFEPDPSSNLPSLETDYSYDALGNLVSVNQQGKSGQTARSRTFQYDALSRLTKSCNPESLPLNTLCNGSNWSLTYGYDGNGNLTAKTDARNITTSYTYDSLNRLTQKNYSDGTGTAYYGYDDNHASFSASQYIPLVNTVGRLIWQCQQQAGGGPCLSLNVFSYDPIGLLNDSWSSSISFLTTHQVDHVHATFDYLGHVLSLTYPDGRTITQGWDGAGRLQNVIYDSWSGNHIGSNYLSSASYFPDGAVQSMAYGNGISETYGRNNRLQITSIVATGGISLGSPSFLNKQYCYTCGSAGANNGNIWQISDLLDGSRTQSYSYDNLNRIVSFSTANASQTYATDSFGNLSQAGTQNSQLSFDGNNRISSGGFSYDASGNIVSVNNGAITTSYTFDSESRISSINSGATTYAYDPEGHRVRKTTGSDWTEYVYFNGQPIAEQHPDGSWSDYIYANGQKIARADSYDQRIHLHGNRCDPNNCGWQSAAWSFPVPAYTVKAGDKITWRQYQAGGAIGGPTLAFNNGANTNWTATDTDGQVMNNLTSHNTWVTRTVDLSPFANTALAAGWIGVEGQTTAGDWDEYFGEIAIYSTDGTVTPIYNRLPGISLSYFGYPGMTNVQANIDHSNSDGDASLPQLNTTYYAADHLGSATMEFSAGGINGPGGWPMWRGEYAPFGQELTASIPTANNYKFTGKERDGESGLDYFGARYYGSTGGRFMSPDYSDDGFDPVPVPSADFENPQSLNLYSYVHNNPLVNVDPDGHDCVLQTRTGEHTEKVSVTAGNCDNVKAGDGQSKTYVAGTVTSITKGANGHSIDVGYTAYGADSNTSASVANLSAAPTPENTNLAYNWGNNAQGYQTFGAADKFVTTTTAVAGLAYGAAFFAPEIASVFSRGDIVFRLAHGMRWEAGHSMVMGTASEVKVAITAAITTGGYQTLANGVIKGSTMVNGTIISFTGFVNGAGKVIISNVMGGFPK